MFFWHSLYAQRLCAADSGASLADIEECSEYDAAAGASSKLSQKELKLVRAKAWEVIRAAQKPDKDFLSKWEKFGELTNSLDLDSRVVLSNFYKKCERAAREIRARESANRRMAERQSRKR